MPKITDLAALVSATFDDILPIVDDPAGIPATKKITLANLKSSLALAKTDVGLGNIDNTADTQKPVSVAQQTALDGKAAITHSHTESDVSNLVTDLAAKVTGNTTIVGATKTKITYDAKGLVTSGLDATTADIADSINKRYVTDAQLTVIGNTSGSNTGDQTLPTKATAIEINTGTDDAKFATSLAIANSNIAFLSDIPAAVTDATITISDILTNNASITKHGWLPKLPGGTTNFLRGDGNWVAPSGGTDPWNYVYVNAGSDFTTSSATAVDVTGLAFTPVANTKYEYEAMLMLRTASATVNPRVGLAWPTGMTDGVALITVSQAATGTPLFAFGNIGAALLTAVGGLPNTTQSWPATIKGNIIAGATPSGTVKVQLASETAATNVTIKAGSFIRYRTI